MRPVAKRIARARAWIERRRRRRRMAHGLVLMYHRVATPAADPWNLAVAPANFAEQMRVLSRDFEVVPLAALPRSLRASRGSRPVAAVTFDDGYLDNLVVAKPILERHAVPATVFVATGFVGRDAGFWWDRLAHAVLGDARLPSRLVVGGPASAFEHADPALLEGGGEGRRARRRLHDRLWNWLCDQSDVAKSEALAELDRWSVRGPAADPLGRPMNEDELRLLVAGGLVDVGAHTATHPRLGHLPLPDQATEIEASRASLRRLLGHEPVAFSYPNGDYVPESVALVREAGFALACDSRADLFWADGDVHRIPRISVADESGSALARRLHWFWLA